MISRRLTNTQKAEILEAYKSGDTTNLIAKNYNCTPNTINRTVKTLLSDTEYTLLKKNRSKATNRNEKLIDNKIVKQNKEDLKQENSLISKKEKAQQEDLIDNVNERSHSSEPENINSLILLDNDILGGDSLLGNQKNKNLDMDEKHQDFDNNFQEITPLISSFDFDQKKPEENFEILDYESLPESVYMIVDKKVELELQAISDLPEWSFLPENELKRIAIVLFSNQRTAKRICSRNQRVIKIPNTKVFNLSKSYLISKGITRLIFEESIIGLDD